MKRLTTDTPSGNFETALNFVYGKDGWAYTQGLNGSKERSKIPPALCEHIVRICETGDPAWTHYGPESGDT